MVLVFYVFLKRELAVLISLVLCNFVANYDLMYVLVQSIEAYEILINTVSGILDITTPRIEQNQRKIV